MRVTRSMMGIAAALLALAAGASSAERVHPKAGTRSAAFLKIGVGARPIALGEAYTAAAEGPEALYWNPAGLAYVEQRELAAMHHLSFESISHSFAAYASPLGPRSGFGFSGTSLFVPSDLERRSGAGEAPSPGINFTDAEGSFGAHDLALGAGYGRRLGPRLALGAALKLVTQSIDGESGATVAGDFGALYQTELPGLRLGASLLHLGPGVSLGSSHGLPTTLRVGAHYAGLFNDRLALYADAAQPVDNYAFLSAGAEHRVLGGVFLRAGYRYRMHGNPLGAASGIRAGAGLEFSGVRLDYAFAPFGDLGSTHRISMLLRFDALGKRKSAVATRPQGMISGAGTPPPLPASPKSVIPLPAAAAAAPALAANGRNPARVLARRVAFRGVDYSVSAQWPRESALRYAELAFTGQGLSGAEFLYELGEKAPEGLPAGSAAYRTLRLGASPALPAGSLELEFALPKAWLAERGLAPEHARLAKREADGSWTLLKARKTGESDSDFTFRAHARALGDFALVGYKP